MTAFMIGYDLNSAPAGDMSVTDDAPGGDQPNGVQGVVSDEPIDGWVACETLSMASRLRYRIAAASVEQRAPRRRGLS